MIKTPMSTVIDTKPAIIADKVEGTHPTSEYAKFIATELRDGGGSSVSTDPKLNMKLAAAKWNAAKKGKK